MYTTPSFILPPLQTSSTFLRPHPLCRHHHHHRLKPNPAPRHRLRPHHNPPTTLSTTPPTQPNPPFNPIGPPAEPISLQTLPLHPYANHPLHNSLHKITGAYAIRDASRTLRYIGYTKDLWSKLEYHKRSKAGGECMFYQVFVPRDEEEVVTADALECVLESWVMENGGEIPVGNLGERELWEEVGGERKEEVGGVGVDERFKDERFKDERFKVDEVGRSGGSYYGEEGYDDYVYGSEEVRPDRESWYGRNEQDSYARHQETYASSFDPRRDRRRDRPGGNNDDYYESNSQYYDSGESDDYDDEFVDVDVDPFDPFSASRYGRGRNRRGTPGSPPWRDGGFGMKDKQDWVPIFMVMGLGTLLWLFGLFSHGGLPVPSL